MIGRIVACIVCGGLASTAAAGSVTADGCNAAEVVGDGVHAFSTAAATTDGPAQPGCPGLVFGDDQIHNDVWLAYSAPCSGTLTVTTCEQLGGAADFDTRVAVYDAGSPCPPNAADLLDCNDDDPDLACGTAAGGFHSTVTAPVVQGGSYLVRVGGFDSGAAGSGVVVLGCTAIGDDGWIQFANETALRVVADPAVSTADPQEKDFAWGDVDGDGDIDLVMVRKEPWNTPGRFPNVLFLNEGQAEGHVRNGVLVDRTLQFASAATDGGSGFLDPTADRDVHLIDVDGDGWLDIVTSTTYGEGLPKTLSHPRVYRNLGAPGGPWLGFLYEEHRTPTLPITPHFCGVGAGDVTGDGAPDLYFVDYNNTLEDRLWINDGTGVFLDETLARVSAAMRESDFGVHAVIRDMNGDGFNDIIKDRGSTLTQPPLRVSILYNDPAAPGFFAAIEHIYNGNPYHTEVGDLNNDGRVDLVIEDDGTDRYLLNLGNGTDGRADFLEAPFSAQGDSFGGNIVIRDLDLDGFEDVLVADVDVDCCGCARALRMWRNRGDVPNVTFEPHTGGIPLADRTGTHDVAVFDINGDALPDIVLGTCTGMSVWIRRPPVGLSFQYPSGLPEFVPPAAPTVIEIDISAAGGAGPAPGSARLHVAVNGGPFVEGPLVDVGGGHFSAALPAAACGDRVAYYFSASDEAGIGYTAPPGGAATPFNAISAWGVLPSSSAGFEDGAPGWTVSNDVTLVSGGWELAIPHGTADGAVQAAPDGDAEPAPRRLAFITGAAPAGSAADVADVDGGPSVLISPPLDLSGGDGLIAYRRWFHSSAANGSDALVIEVSDDDGANWTAVEEVQTTRGTWEAARFQVGAHVTPTASVRVRFVVSDAVGGADASIVEAGIDALHIQPLQCSPCATPSECATGLFCTGSPICIEGVCGTAGEPCASGLCDEAADACVACFQHAHCDDGAYCDGPEMCLAGACLAGAAPCGAALCNDFVDGCVDCLGNGDCDDGSFCNGSERCVAGACQAGTDPCGGAACDEGAATCSGPIVLQPRMGDPLSDLSPAQRARFDAGRVAFNRAFDVADGLGPTFNQISCAACHNNPIGGSGTITVQRFGRLAPKGGVFDDLGGLGGSLRQAQAIDDQCLETIPPEATVVATRSTPSTLGFGLLEAIADADLLVRAVTPPAPHITGRAHLVQPLEDPLGPQRVGRFGWKASVATVLTFSGDAALNEMGITNDLVSTENAPNGDAALLALCDTVPDPEDAAAPGARFIDQVTDFQRYLAAPPQTPRGGMSGEDLFVGAGCADCHVPWYVTSQDAALEPALRGRVIRPYSDFLLHDMGTLFDGIAQGDALPGEVRTPPLWGLRVRDPLLHDASVAGGSFEQRVIAAVLAHGGVGSEARPAVEVFAAFSPADQDAVVAFLDSLGRAEFDHNGDGAVDAADYAAFAACFAAAGPFTPDDSCALSDVNRDGQVDGTDLAVLELATDDPVSDCDGNGMSDLQELLTGAALDCNVNGRPDACDVATTGLDQWASSVLAFSSQYSTTAFSAAQALGVPDTFSYGANATTWSPLPANGSLEFITVAFDEVVFAEGLTVRETEGNGFVVGVEVQDLGGVFHSVWSGIDPSLPGAPVDFHITWPLTAFEVQAVRVHTDTNHDPSGWESVDALRLHGRRAGASRDDNGDGAPDECQCRYGDVDLDGAVDLDDVLCVVDGFAGLGACVAVAGDLAPCSGDGLIDLADIIAILDAFAGTAACPPSCP